MTVIPPGIVVLRIHASDGRATHRNWNSWCEDEVAVGEEVELIGTSDPPAAGGAFVRASTVRLSDAVRSENPWPYADSYRCRKVRS
jgi:hypothetical protein